VDRYHGAMDEEEVHVIKARECLAGAASELAFGRFNNAANRAYYACFHAAIVALLRAGVSRRIWSHKEVPALFAGILIGQRKLYPAGLRRMLYDAWEVRQVADYSLSQVSRSVARGIIRDTTRFVQRVIGEGL
jgi:uncharacterized protein (UPF0332 family)